jgi:hypothetical protein
VYEGFEIVANNTKMLRAPKNTELSPGELRSIGLSKGMPRKNAAAEEKKKAEERLALLLK